MEKIKILGILPYQEMEPLMRDVVRSYENVELYTFTGFYRNAIQFAKAFPDKEFDVIISRGGTATLLREMNDTPVVDIQVSTLDLLRVITQAVQCSSKAAVVSYPYITSQVDTLAAFLRVNIATFSFDTPQQIESTVKQCVQAGYDFIVGGAATRDHVVAEGAQFLLITSSRECIQDSIEQAIELYHLISNVLDTNRLFQSIIDKSSSAVFLFNENGEYCYTNVAARKLLNSVDRLENFLTRNIATLKEAGELRLVKKLNNDFYEITGSIISIRQQFHYQFELRFRSAGYRVSPFAKVESPEEVMQSQQLLGASELYLRPLSKTIQTASESALPVLIQGEIGTRKGLVARHIHTKSSSEGATLIRLRCNDLTEKNWSLLLNNSESLLHSTGYTIYFENVDVLPLELQRQIASYIEDTKMAIRHRLISSSCRDLSVEVAHGRFSSRLYLQLSGFTINILPLSQRKEDIPSFINLMIPQYNTALGRSVVGLEPDAMELMVNFEWPLNLVQMEKVLRQMIAASSSFYLTAAEVIAVLNNETREVSPAPSFDLSGTLEEIERRVIEQVLREENMNQSAAAKRLGIGRSTLWRKIAASETSPIGQPTSGSRKGQQAIADRK